jgi:acyl carrier protein
MTREEYKKIINDILVSENARELEEHELLKDSGLDSFGFIVLYITLDAEYHLNKFDNAYATSIDYNNYTLKDMLDRIEDVC